MIEIDNISKSFDGFCALSNITTTITEGQVFGLIGTNGAGKSTLLRILAGIYKPDTGKITVDGEPLFDNPSAKSKIFFISDNQYFIQGGTPMDMVLYYEALYPNFNRERFLTLMKALNLDPGRRIGTFSKGMKKQLSVMLGISSGTKYLLCDETFDGLDPVIRQAIKKLFISEMDTNGLTPIIASHNLRELEDICDHVGLLHKGGILFSRDLDEMKLGLFRVQIAFREATDYKRFAENYNILNDQAQGSLHLLTIRCSREEIEQASMEYNPAFFEILPLSLEEIFISETEVLGYDFNNLI